MFTDGSRLRSRGAQCTQTLAVEVQQCPLRTEVGEELGQVKSWQGGGGGETGGGGRGGRGGEEEEDEEEENNCDKI